MLHIWLLSVFIFNGLFASAPAGAAWQEEWERVLAAAKQEGRIAILGTTGAEARDSLTLPFQKQYGIRVEYHGASGSQQSQRVAMERQAGQYLWDVFIGGTTTALTGLFPIKAVDPIEPALILPDVKDPKNWRGGGLEFIDENRQTLVMTPAQRVILALNSELVDPKGIKSYKDLLEPKWKGKIVMDDPRQAGSSQATFTFFYLHPELGPNFIRALIKQDPVIFRDPAQSLNTLAQGKYPALVGPRDTNLSEALKRNLPIVIVDPRQVREGSDVSPGAGNVALFNKAPNPSAAKVYLNWLLSKDGQHSFAKAMGYVSNRLDVPTDHVEPWRVPKPGAIKTYTQEAINTKEPLLALLNEILKR